MTTRSAKQVVLGVTGSIAAYKACEIASLLVRDGFDVQAVLSESAAELVGAATFEGITSNRAITALFDPVQNAEIDHIAVAKRADLFLVAPATANTIAKTAQGIADDWLSTALLVTQAPILFAPAMNTNMHDHAATQANLDILRQRGCHFVGPDAGTLACKTVGIGRMSEPLEVVSAAKGLLDKTDELAGKRVLITSGGSRESIDPVRYIGNHSSGKMGFAIAMEALQRGAQVTVVAGPAAVSPPGNAEIIPVQSALEMHDAVMARVAEVDVVIGAAAVADYRVANQLTEKHKRTGQNLSLDLVENPDIMAAVGSAKKNGTILVGFAAETEDVIANATRKIAKKNLDLIVANEVGTAESGFGTETIKAAFIDASGQVDDQPLMAKRALADKLLDRIVALLA